MTPRLLLAALFISFLAVPAFAQERLSLDDAVRRALAQNPAVRSAQAAAGAAGEKVAQARAGYLPRLSLVESVQRGNQPVFAFSSLLAAREFAGSNLSIGALNHPAAITNFHTALAFEQPIFDGLATRAATRSAEIGRTIAETEHLQTREDLVLATTRTYGQVLLAAAKTEAAHAAVQAADEDVARAHRRRDAGLATDADVLALQVHAAEMRAREIQAAGDQTIARTELNQAMGEPLDRQFTLDPVSPAATPLPGVDELEREALAARSELRAAQLQQALARESRRAARAALLPQVSLQGFLELDGNGTAFGNRASAWLVGAQARWNLFSGLADIARLRETALTSARAAAERDRIETSVRVDVRTAAARVQSADARQRVGEATVVQARESQRIIRDRYDAGLSSVNDVLRAANTVLDAESQRIGALVDLLVSRAMLDRALGRRPADVPR